MIRRSVFVECDRCFTHGPRGSLAMLARQEAAARGWTVARNGKGDDLCPPCGQREGQARVSGSDAPPK